MPGGTIMPTLRIISLLLFPFLIASACGAAQQAQQTQQTQQPPAPKIVSLTASEGTILKATYFASSKPGPGVLLLHQCNQQRKLWDPLGESLAATGISVLAFDYRGFGESGGTPHDKLTPQQENKIQTETWPGDIDVAFQYLLAQPGVNRERIGAGGASCGVENAVQLARRHPEVKSLVLLAGPTDREGRLFVQSSTNLPIFTSAADDDPFGPQPLLMQWLFSISQNPSSRFAHYTSGGHAAEMFAVQKELPGIIATWFSATLTRKPGLVPKTNGSPLAPQVLSTLALIDQTGGALADQVGKTLAADRQLGDQTPPFPEVIVNQLGYEHLQLGDLKGAVEIMKLNVAAYPNSPNAYDSLSDAYLAAGQKDLALQNAKEAIALLANDTAENEQRRNDIRDSAQEKINQLTQPPQ